tara:strand:- start:6347 stop:7480 length:1134 start_codon:yes stop_codon:yes gene_type:complete
MMKFLVSTIGDPESASTYSGVPYNLFSSMDQKDLIVKRINGFDIRRCDALSGYYDIRQSVKRRKPYRSSLWRYRYSSIEKLSARIDQKTEDVDYNVFFQIGCGGLPSKACVKVAHIEIPLHTCIDDPIFAASYGFDNVSSGLLKEALDGEKYFFHSCDIIWTNTEWTKQQLLIAGAPESKILVFPPCVKSASIPLLDRAFDVPRILFVGKDWERKGGPEVVEMFRYLRGVYPTATLDIVGCTPSVGDVSGISIHGFLDKRNSEHSALLDRIYERVNVFLMPSSWESTGIVYFEAMQRSLPVIMIRGQGREYLFDGIARIAENATPHALLAEIKALFDSESEAQKLVKHAYQAVNEKFTYDVFIEILQERILKVKDKT